MKIEIRPLVNTDHKAVIDLVLQVQQIEFSLPITLEDQPDLQDIEAFYRATGGDFWGAFVKDRLVGTVALISLGQGAGAIRKMFVEKEYRGKEWGIAQQLLETLLNYCGQKGITDLYLGTVEILKAAHRFYEKNGFRRVTRDDLPSYFPVMGVDNVFYHARLSRSLVPTSAKRGFYFTCS